MDPKERLEKHIEESYDHEVFCMVPTDIVGCVLGTEYTNSEEDLAYCTVCETRGGPVRGCFEEEMNCSTCGKVTKHELVTLPVVRCILSEKRVLQQLIDEAAPDVTNDDIMSHYCHNVTGGYYGPGTPIFIDELEELS
jgi:hypothetical protein